MLSHLSSAGAFSIGPMGRQSVTPNAKRYNMNVLGSRKWLGIDPIFQCTKCTQKPADYNDVPHYRIGDSGVEKNAHL